MTLSPDLSKILDLTLFSFRETQSINSNDILFHFKKFKSTTLHHNVELGSVGEFSPRMRGFLSSSISVIERTVNVNFHISFFKSFFLSGPNILTVFRYSYEYRFSSSIP